MKRKGGLFDRIADARTLVFASWRAAQGKRHRPEVHRFLSRLDEETGRLAHELQDGTYRFGHYRTFDIRDPKTRAIHAPPFCDRVVHHSMIAVAGSIFERGAIAHSYACRAGRGQHAALSQVRQWLRTGDWFLKADVAKFYDNINHEILRTMLARRFRERRLLSLFDRLLDSYSKSPGKGLPIGALTSQYLGNFYLDPLDHWVGQTCHLSRYVRYMDDLLFLADYSTLESLRKPMDILMEGLGLKIKNNGILNQAVFGVPFLGFVLYPNRIRLNRLGRRRLRRKAKDMERGWEAGRLSESDLQARGEALFAHARFGDDIAWRRAVTAFSRFGETQEPDPRSAGRLLEQHRQQMPLSLSQQEQAG